MPHRVKDKVATGQINFDAISNPEAISEDRGTLFVMTEGGRTVLYFKSDNGEMTRLTSYLTAVVDDSEHVWTFEDGRLVEVYEV